MNKPQQILVIGRVWPEPTSSASGQRIIKLIKFFIAKGYNVTFASAALPSEFAADLAGLGVSCANIQLNCSSFDRFVAELQPAIVLFDRFVSEEQFGWRVAEHCPEALRIIDTQDLHCLRHARQMALKNNSADFFPYLNSEIAMRELASIWRSDLSLIVSEFELRLLTEHFKVNSSLLHYMPLLLSMQQIEQAEQSWQSFEVRSGFVFIGNFVHEPNWDCVRYLKEQVWPRLSKQLPGVELQIFGAYTSEKALRLHAPEERFFVSGRAESAITVLSAARICLAPLRFGAGQKGKLLDAMLAGTPSVVSNVGAESMSGNSLWPGIIADTLEEVVEACVSLYNDRTAWLEAQERGKSIVKVRFQDLFHENEFFKRLVDLQSAISTHRQANFIGAMLRHHSLLSTKYLSRWIESKAVPTSSK